MSYRQIVRDCAYLLPQLAAIYYAGQYGIKVIIDSEDPIGIPVTARLPELNLIIDVAIFNFAVDKHSFWFYYIDRTFVCF